MEPILQLTSRGAVVQAAPGTLAALAATFRAECCARLPRLIEPALLSRIQRSIERSAFVERRHGTIASELCMERNTALGLLHFLANDATVFDLVQRITGIAGLRFFVGRVYRRGAPPAPHHSLPSARPPPPPARGSI